MISSSYQPTLDELRRVHMIGEGDEVREHRDRAERLWRKLPIGEHGHQNIGLTTIQLAHKWGVEVPDLAGWARRQA